MRWDRILREHGWTEHATGAYWPLLRWIAPNGDVYEILHVDSVPSFAAWKNNIYTGIQGDLTECLEQCMAASGNPVS